MDLTDDDVLEILRLIEESEFDYLEIEKDDLKLIVSKSGHVPEGAVPSAAPTAPPPEPAPSPDAAPAAPAPEPAARAGLVPVTAPMVGTFYRAPDPESPPFVEQGARVDADTTVGLIEVMKVFTSIAAGAPGVIAEVVAGNARFVEFGEVLFYVKPDGGAS